MISRPTRALRPVVLMLVLVAGCGSPATESADEPARASPSASPTSAAPTASPSPSPSRSRQPPRAGTAIIADDSDFGTMLYDATGQPVYLFTAEDGTRPACYGDCAADWPPVLTRGKPSGAGAVRAGLLGTTRRTDGTAQVTYAGHPLYYYAHEGKYEVLCHDVEEYGGTWLVVQPAGTAAPA